MININSYFRFVNRKYPWLDISVYKKLMNTFAIIFTLFFTIIAYIYYNDILSAICVGLIIGSIIIMIFYYYPYYLKKVLNSKIKSELPFFLIDLDIKLAIGLDFQTALSSASENYSLLKELFDSVTIQYQRGISYNKSFLELSNFFEDLDVTRVLNQILSVYYSGYNVRQRALFSLAEELLNKQKSELKTFNKNISLNFTFVYCICRDFACILFSIYYNR
jgi:Flp pilus assembly protein TadB